MSILVRRFAQIDTIFLEFEEGLFSISERKELEKVLVNIFHHYILDVILDNLEKPDRIIFLEKVTVVDEYNLIDFLRAKIIGVEELLKKSCEQLRLEILDDLKKGK